jgi:hypothetical protein
MSSFWSTGKKPGWLTPAGFCYKCTWVRSECFPPSLTLLALNYVAKGYGAGSSIYDLFVRKAGALFYSEATP